MATIGFSDIPAFLDEHNEQARSDLSRYFSAYTGRWFEHFSALSDPAQLDANDIAACETLSVSLDGKVVDQLMSHADDINALLAKAPPKEATLFDIDPEGSEYQAMTELYDHVRAIDGMGYVRTSKLLASKRPHLVPIRDSVVETLLGKPSSCWLPWRTVVANHALREQVDALTPPEVPAGTSILRRLDVILWMHGTAGNA